MKKIYKYCLFFLIFLIHCSAHAMMDDDEANIIPQFVRYLEGRWNIDNDNAQTQVFSIPLPRAAYPPHPAPKFSLSSFSLAELKYDGAPLTLREEKGRKFYEGKVGRKTISLEVNFGSRKISFRGKPHQRKVVFGPQSFSLGKNNAIFEPELPTKSFVIVPRQNDQNTDNLRDYLNSIRKWWTGCPTLIYQGTLDQGARLELKFKGQNQNGREFHRLSPTTLLYALDTVRKEIGVFVMIKLPHFGSQFQCLTERKLPPRVHSQLLPGQIFYDGNHMYQEVREQTTTCKNLSEKWLRNWGPQAIIPKHPIPWAQQLAHFNQQQELQYSPVNPLETIFIERRNQGVKRQLPAGRYTELRGPVRKKARTIYSNPQGELSIARKTEREWRPVINAAPRTQSYIVSTYFDTGIHWPLFDDDIIIEPTDGSFTDRGRWREGLYEGIPLPQNNQIIEWKKLDTSPHERTVYRMNLGNRGTMDEMDNLLQPEEMTLKAFVENISYYPITSLNLLEKNDLKYKFLNNIFSLMTNINEIYLNFNFGVNKNTFENFIDLLENKNIKRNLNTFELRFSNCPAFSKQMSTTLGTCLADFEKLEKLKIEIPYVRSYRESLKPTLLMGLVGVRVYDVWRLRMGISYEEYLTLARELAESRSLKEIRFCGLQWDHDKNNIRTEIKNIDSDIRVFF